MDYHDRITMALRGLVRVIYEDAHSHQKEVFYEGDFEAEIKAVAAAIVGRSVLPLPTAELREKVRSGNANPPELEKEILKAITSCRHRIDANAVELLYDPGAPGNALHQLVERIMGAIRKHAKEQPDA